MMGGICEGLHGDNSFQIGEHVWSMCNNLEKKRKKIFGGGGNFRTSTMCR